jgi:hypothetical protein
VYNVTNVICNTSNSSVGDRRIRSVTGTIFYKYHLLQVAYVTSTICYKYHMLQVPFATLYTRPPVGVSDGLSQQYAEGCSLLVTRYCMMNAIRLKCVQYVQYMFCIGTLLYMTAVWSHSVGSVG